MHLFHSSHLLLFCVLESIQGEEFIDFGPHGGIVSLELFLGAAEDSNFHSLSAL